MIHPPMRIMGRTLVTFPFIMSVSMLGSEHEADMDETLITYMTEAVKRGGNVTLITYKEAVRHE